MASAKPGSTSAGVIGVYPDLATARKGIMAVEGKGVESRRIRLMGEPARDAATDADVSGRDANVTSFIARSTLLWGAIGVVVGALIGVLVGALTNSNVAVNALAGAIFFGLFGWVLGGYSKMGATEAWELTFQPEEEGQVAVGVQTSDEHTLKLAAEALREAGAVKVNRC